MSHVQNAGSFYVLYFYNKTKSPMEEKKSSYFFLVTNLSLGPYLKCSHSKLIHTNTWSLHPGQRQTALNERGLVQRSSNDMSRLHRCCFQYKLSENEKEASMHQIGISPDRLSGSEKFARTSHLYILCKTHILKFSARTKFIEVF